MTVWVVRAGSEGQHESRFLDDGRIYLTRPRVNFDILKVPDWAELRSKVDRRGGSSITRQCWVFAHLMQVGDFVILPLRRDAACFRLGKIAGSYRFELSEDEMYRHSRQVQWSKHNIPRDILPPSERAPLSLFLSIYELKPEAVAKFGLAAESIDPLASQMWEKR